MLVVSFFCDPMDYSLQNPLSMGFPRQNYWSALSMGSQRVGHPWDFLGKSSGVGCHLRNKWQGSPALTLSFLTNPASLHYTWLLYTRLQGRKFCRSVKKDFFQDGCDSPPLSCHWQPGLPFSGAVLATGCPSEVSAQSEPPGSTPAWGQVCMAGISCFSPSEPGVTSDVVVLLSLH